MNNFAMEQNAAHSSIITPVTAAFETNGTLTYYVPCRDGFLESMYIFIDNILHFLHTIVQYSQSFLSVSLSN